MSDGIATRAGAGASIDRVAMAVSGLCLVHCVATAVLFGLVSSVSVVLANPLIHEVGLLAAILLAALGLGAGYRAHGLSTPLAAGTAGLILMASGLVVPHGPLEAMLTIPGVALLGLGHHLNRRAACACPTAANR